MKHLRETDVLRDVLVPLSLIADLSGFSGKPAGDCLRGDLVFKAGKVAGLRPVERRADESVQAPTGLVLPLLVEPHCHLDKCHTASRLDGWAASLDEAITLQARDKRLWTETDLRHRIAAGVTELVASGVGLARSHVDWGTTAAPPLAWDVLAECAADAGPAITLQPAAFTDLRMIAEPGAAEQVARIVRRSGGALGAFVLGQPDMEAGLDAMFRAADRYGLPLDFHVDEDLDPNLDGVERIADHALRTGHVGPILLSHASALSCLPEADRSRVIDKLARAGITVVVLPSTNLFLQDRAADGAARRGLAPVRALQAGGVPVCVGADNVCDAFCPVGRHDPVWVLGLSALAAQLAGPAGALLPMITTIPARALGCPAVTIDRAAMHELMIVPDTGTGAFLSMAPPVRTRLADLLQQETT